MSLCRFHSAGRFISRGKGRHPTRVIDSYELIFVVSGELEIAENQQNFRLTPGQWLLLYPGRLHCGTAAYRPELSFFWNHFLPEDPEREAHLRALPQTGSCLRPEHLANLYSLLLTEQRELGRNRHALDLLTELLLNELELTDDVTAPPTAKILAEQAMSRIRLRFEEELSTSILAHELNCNQDYLGRVFLRSYGLSITRAINRERIGCAKKLLSSSTLSIKEIAFESGFNDPAYFRRQFFRECATTPRAYREEHSGGHINTE